MKIILIQPPVQDFYDTEIRLQPLGLCMLKGALKKFFPQLEVGVWDYHQGYGRRTLPLPGEFTELEAYYAYPDSSPFCTFYNYYHFGASFEKIARDVAHERPDLVGISSLFSPYHREVIACAREIKKHLEVPILLGGSHVSAAPFLTLSDPNVDFIIRGEGERPLVEFVKAYCSKHSLDRVPNLGFKRNGELILNPVEPNYALDALPPPDLSDFSKDRYLFKGRPLCFITTSRGCPHHCTFCSVHLTFGNGFQRRSPEKVLTEIRQRYREGYRVFDFEDDNLAFHKQEFRTILQALIDEFPNADLELLAMNGISYLNLDKETLSLMRKAGFRHLDLSLVSSSAAVLKTLRRPHTLEKYLDVVAHAHRLGFDIVSYLILGLPVETLEDMTGTMVLMAALPVLIGASIFYLTPGCVMAENSPVMAEADVFKSRSTAMAVETDHFTRDDVYTLLVAARLINFLKGLRSEKMAIKLHEALEELAGQSARGRTGADLFHKLLREKRLYAATKQGLKLLPRFRAELFMGLLEKAGNIRTKQGALIVL